MRHLLPVMVLLALLGCGGRREAPPEPPPEPPPSAASPVAAASPEAAVKSSPRASSPSAVRTPTPVLDAQGQPTGWHEIRDPKAGYSLRYPDGLHFLNDPATLGLAREAAAEHVEGSDLATAGLQFFLFQTQPGVMVEFNPNLNLVLENVTPLVGPLTSRKYGEISMQNLPRMIPGAKVLGELQSRRLGNVESWTAQADFTMEGMDMRSTFFTLFDPETRIGYTLTVTEQRKDAGKSLPRFLKAVDTFRLE